MHNLKKLGKVATSSPAIRRKDESQNGCYKNTKYAKFSEKKEHFLPTATHTQLYVWERRKGLNMAQINPSGRHRHDI